MVVVVVWWRANSRDAIERQKRPPEARPAGSKELPSRVTVFLCTFSWKATWKRWQWQW